RARLHRVWRHARLACTAPLHPSEKRFVCKVAAQRSLDILEDAARRVMRLAYRRVIPRSTRTHFTRIYQRNTFGGLESLSRGGVTMEQTATIRQEIPALLRELGAKSLLDAPCGDFNW